MSEEKHCTNCKYYKIHYIISGIKLVKTSGAHCICNKMPLRISSKHIKVNNACEMWESIELRKIERKQSICKMLKETKNSLDELAKILKEEKID